MPTAVRPPPPPHSQRPIIPHIELGQDLTVELAESVQILLTQDTPLDLFTWAPPLGLSCGDCPEPLATPAETTTYTLTVEARAVVRLPTASRCRC
jgi:hypothetical protein